MACELWDGVAWKAGVARKGRVRRGVVRYGKAGMAGLEGRGPVRFGKAWHGKAGMDGSERMGDVRAVKAGTARLRRDRRGRVEIGRLGMDGFGMGGEV